MGSGSGQIRFADIPLLGDSRRWRPLHYACKRNPRAISILYEVRRYNIRVALHHRRGARYADQPTIAAMTASQMRIAETIDAFYGDSGAKDGVSRSYKQAVEDLDAETIKALDGPYRWVLNRTAPGNSPIQLVADFHRRTTVLEPIGRFCAYFPDVNECRPSALLSYPLKERIDRLTLLRHQEALPQAA